MKILGGWIYCDRMSRELAANAIVIEALIVLVIAPLAGVMLARRAVARSRAASAFIGAVALFTVVCGATAASGSDRETWLYIAESQATMASAALALGALGACAATLFSDVLDAAASSLAVSAVCGCGIFVAGAPVADMSTTALNVVLLASPVVAAASAANIDLFRGAFLYQYSSVAHRLFAYPAWYAASALYLAVAVVMLGAAVLRIRAATPTSLSSAHHPAHPETLHTLSRR